MFDFGHKQLVTYQESRIFAELLILRLLEAHGWNGVWVSCYGGTKYLGKMPKDSLLADACVPLPDDRERLLNQIWRRAGRREAKKAPIDVGSRI